MEWYYFNGRHCVDVINVSEFYDPNNDLITWAEIIRSKANATRIILRIKTVNVAALN